MDDLEGLAANLRAEREVFRREAGEMQQILSDSLRDGADSGSRGIESALRRATRAGKLEFQDLARVAGRALGEIASSALGLSGGSGLGGLLGSAGVGLLGLPGRATGGPVAPGRAYMVGERGPEVFVPQSSGRIDAPVSAASAVNVTVNVNVPREAGSVFMAQTGRQVARSVRRALDRAGR